jgi:peptide deformylase
MVLPILLYGNSKLREKAEEVSDFKNPSLKKLIAELWDTLDRASGLGLAAPQIGSNIRVFIARIPDDYDCPPFNGAFINPVILEQDGEQFEEEGCLSVPSVYARVRRPLHVKVHAQDINGESFTIEGTGSLARVICHELDHLNGVLFVDYLSPIKKATLYRQLKEIETRALV